MKQISIFRAVFVFWVAITISTAPVAVSAAGSIVQFQGDSVKVDHLGAGFALSNAHAEIVCIDCHTEGMFTNLAFQCFDFHNGELSTGMSPT